MSNQVDQQPGGASHSRIGIGLVLGIAVGVAIGLGIGAALGVAMDQQRKDKDE
jgi:ABC-type nitrate/sulfonate/bicarbonate transport system permease component